MVKTKVYITGIGVVNALGSGRDAFFQNLCLNRCAAANLPEDQLQDFFKKKAVRIPDEKKDQSEKDHYGRACYFMLQAAKQAVSEAEIDSGTIKKFRVGLCVGTAAGDTGDMESWYCANNYRQPLTKRQSPQLKRYPLQNIADTIAEKYGISGPVVTVTAACASGALALETAYDWIKRDQVDIALCGGVDVFRLLAHFTLAKYRIMASEQFRPFDIDREGILLGEGAGMLVLESYKTVKKRNRAAAVSVYGTGSSFDCFSLSGKDKSAQNIVSAMHNALSCAQLKPNQIDCILAHGIGTVVGDAAEMSAVNAVFSKNRENCIPVTAIKGAIGHTQGASGILNAIVAVEIIRRQVIPPIVNTIKTDPLLEHMGVLAQPLSCKVNTVMANCLSFGGHASSLILGKIK